MSKGTKFFTALTIAVAFLATFSAAELRGAVVSQARGSSNANPDERARELTLPAAIPPEARDFCRACRCCRRMTQEEMMEGAANFRAEMEGSSTARGMKANSSKSPRPERARQLMMMKTDAPLPDGGTECACCWGNCRHLTEEEILEAEAKFHAEKQGSSTARGVKANSVKSPKPERARKLMMMTKSPTPAPAADDDLGGGIECICCVGNCRRLKEMVVSYVPGMSQLFGAGYN